MIFVGQHTALPEAKLAAIRDLESVVAYCASGEWGDDETLPISPAAVQNARNLIAALPDGLPLPEFAPDPDGSISLDWGVSLDRYLTVSVGEGDRMAYAWKSTCSHGHGVAGTDNEVFELARRITGGGAMK